MSHQNYFKVSGTIFLIAALAHLWRVVNGLTLRFGSNLIPTWASWAAILIGGYLAYQGLKKK